MDVSNFKLRKKKLHLTTAELADLAELPVGTVSKVMTGETKAPSYVTIERIDAALLREETTRRIRAYCDAIRIFLEEHSPEEYEPEIFEENYRRTHQLTKAPIPFAVPIEEEDIYRSAGNLAVQFDSRATIQMLSQLEESRWVELIDGQMIFNDAPSYEHQMLVDEIGGCIRNYIRANHGECRVNSAGMNVQLDRDDFTMVIPDVVVICDPSKITKRGISGPPDWIVEVVSPSTRRCDYGKKMCKYIAAGVREYWIVDVEKRMTTVYICGEPTVAYVYDFLQEIPVHIYDGSLKITIEYLLDMI